MGSNSTVVASILASNVQALAFSPDNHWLALMTNYWVTVWSLPKLDGHRVVGRVTVDSHPIRGPDGMITFTLHVLCVRPEDLIREPGTRLTANLTKSEWAKYVGDQIEFYKTFPDFP